MLKLYSDLASRWPLLSAPEDYADEAAFFIRIFEAAGLPERSSLLEFGCGGGNNAVHLKAHFHHVTLTDLSPSMLEVSRALNSDCEHLQGDMRSLRLGRQFDAVFIHDAIDYLTSVQDLRLAMETAFVHCSPGGVALFVPDHVRERFKPSTEHGGHDGDGHALRYLEWTYDPDEGDTTCTTEYVYVLREGHQPVRIEHEQHIFGLFAREEWLRLLQDVGFEAKIVEDAYNRELFLGRKPRGQE